MLIGSVIHEAAPRACSLLHAKAERPAVDRLTKQQPSRQGHKSAAAGCSDQRPSKTSDLCSFSYEGSLFASIGGNVLEGFFFPKREADSPRGDAETVACVTLGGLRRLGRSWPGLLEPFVRIVQAVTAVRPIPRSRP